MISQKEEKKQQGSWILKQLGTALIHKNVFKEHAKDGSLDELFARCLSLGGVQFEDASFPPSRLSLILDWSDDKCAQEKIQNKSWGKITWERASRIPSLCKDGKLAIFVDGIEPNDVIQGKLGNCWFLCAISSLAEYPERVERLFRNSHSGPNEFGIYGVNICKNGQWTDIVIDDWIPVKNG
jgi:hypothetical protein